MHLVTAMILGTLFWSHISFAVTGNYQDALKLRRAIEQVRPVTRAAETIKLPTSRGFNQGGTQLCWSYSTLNVLESSWLARHPEIPLELSRRTMQFLTMKERYTSYIHGTDDYISERGVSVDARDLIEENGLVAFSDFSDITDPYGRNNIKKSIDAAQGTALKLEVLEQQLMQKYGLPPEHTHINGREVSRREAADIITRQEAWISFTPSKDGSRGWIKHPDPDARPQTKSYAIPSVEVVDKIKWALRNNYAVEYSNSGHSVTIYGADYDSDGRPTNYYMKDSYPDYFYNASPANLMANMLEITIPNAEL